MNFINNLHLDLKFTQEIGPRQLAFLETKIHLLSDIECVCISNMFREIINTKFLLNYNANCPWIRKICLIYCFLNRVSSNWSLLHKKNYILKNIFHRNGCRHRIFDNYVSKFLVEKSVIFKCYSNEELMALTAFHEVVPTWYSFHSCVH